MAVERETLRDAALATVGVVVFIAFLIAGGLMHAGNGGELGALLIVAGIVAFIVVMGGIGLLFLGGD
ncbi:MAG: hypothetical protein ABEI31_03835 [Halodesulfurarchaeum sp.]